MVLKLSANSDYKKYATDGEDNGYENLVNILDTNGYEVYYSIDNILTIYHK